MAVAAETATAAAVVMTALATPLAQAETATAELALVVPAVASVQTTPKAILARYAIES